MLIQIKGVGREGKTNRRGEGSASAALCGESINPKQNQLSKKCIQIWTRMHRTVLVPSVLYGGARLVPEEQYEPGSREPCTSIGKLTRRIGSARSTTYHAGIADRLLRSLRKIERVQFELKQRACVRQVIANNLNSDVRLGAAVPSGRTP